MAAASLLRVWGGRTGARISLARACRRVARAASASAAASVACAGATVASKGCNGTSCGAGAALSAKGAMPGSGAQAPERPPIASNNMARKQALFMRGTIGAARTP